jgi:hypothetical protein
MTTIMIVVLGLVAGVAVGSGSYGLAIVATLGMIFLSINDPDR